MCGELGRLSTAHRLTCRRAARSAARAGRVHAEPRTRRGRRGGLCGVLGVLGVRWRLHGRLLLDGLLRRLEDLGVELEELMLARHRELDQQLLDQRRSKSLL